MAEAYNTNSNNGLDDTLVLEDDDDDNQVDTLQDTLQDSYKNESTMNINSTMNSTQGFPQSNYNNQMQPQQYPYYNNPTYADVDYNTENYYVKSDNSDVCDAWITASEQLQQNKIDQAYKIILDSEDDIYLLRLMIKTGPSAYKKMDQYLANKLFNRVIQLTKVNFLDNMILNFFLEACQNNFSSHIQQDNKQNMIIVLESMIKTGSNEQLIRIILDFLKSR